MACAGILGSSTRNGCCTIVSKATRRSLIKINIKLILKQITASKLIKYVPNGFKKFIHSQQTVGKKSTNSRKLKKTIPTQGAKTNILTERPHTHTEAKPSLVSIEIQRKRTIVQASE